MKVRLDNADHFEGVYRLDRGAGFMREPKRTEEGYLVTEAIVAKPGVLFYRLPNGATRRELVLPEELANPSSMATIANKPATLEHPKGGLLTPKTVQQHSQGTVTGEARIDDEGRLVVPLVVQGQAALDALDRGVREVSPGYRCRIDNTPGVHPRYGAYDCIQRGRRYNHVAITERARGGRDITIRTDAAVEVDPFTAGIASASTREDSTMDPIILALIAAGLTKEQAEAGAPGVSAALSAQARQDADDAIEAKTAAEAAKADLEAKLAAEKDRADTAEKLQTRLDWHKDRTALEAMAADKKVADTDRMDNAELRRAILKAAKVEIEGKSDEWVSARLDAMSDMAKTRNDSERGAAFRVLSANTQQQRSDSDEPKRPPTVHRSVRRYGPQAK